jgi:hypothetical protein
VPQLLTFTGEFRHEYLKIALQWCLQWGTGASKLETRIPRTPTSRFVRFDEMTSLSDKHWNILQGIERLNSINLDTLGEAEVGTKDILGKNKMALWYRLRYHLKAHELSFETHADSR